MENMESIKVFYKSVYGNDLVYPGCSTAVKFLDLIGTKTFSNYHLNKIKSLGYKVQFVAYSPNNIED